MIRLGRAKNIIAEKDLGLKAFQPKLQAITSPTNPSK
jgi:hypothetical protein